MKPVDQIHAIAKDAIRQALGNGWSPKYCVWELSPSILSAIVDNGDVAQVPDPAGFVRYRYYGIRCRRNCDESTGIMLRLVHQEKWG